MTDETYKKLKLIKILADDFMNTMPDARHWDRSTLEMCLFNLSIPDLELLVSCKDKDEDNKSI